MEAESEKMVNGRREGQWKSVCDEDKVFLGKHERVWTWVWQWLHDSVNVLSAMELRTQEA